MSRHISGRYPNNLREPRLALGYTQKELGRLAGVSASTISTIERKRDFNAYLRGALNGTLSRTHFETAIRLAVVLGYLEPGVYSFEEVKSAQKLFRPQQLTDRGRRPVRQPESPILHSSPRLAVA